MQVTVEYVVDWESRSQDDQIGHITITTPKGLIEATWSSTGGMGDGCKLISNDSELSDEEAETLLDDADLCQGNGTYKAELVEDEENGGYTIEDVVWQDGE